MSADVIIPVLQTALLGFFRDFTKRVIKSPLKCNPLKHYGDEIYGSVRRKLNEEKIATEQEFTTQLCVNQGLTTY